MSAPIGQKNGRRKRKGRGNATRLRGGPEYKPIQLDPGSDGTVPERRRCMYAYALCRGLDPVSFCNQAHPGDINKSSVRAQSLFNLVFAGSSSGVATISLGV